MKIADHEQVQEIVEEILNTENWTGLTLRQLAFACRITSQTDLSGWVRQCYAQNDMVFGGFFSQRVLEQLKFEIDKLN